MNYTIYNGELYHYGVKGMKWGVRRYERQSSQVRQLQEKRKQIAATKGVTSKQYDKASKELYLKKNKATLTKAKIDNDTTTQVLAKQKIRNARSYKKHGVDWSDGNAMRSVYGYNLSKKEREAIATKIATKEYQTNKRKRIAKTAISVAPAVVAAGVAVFNANRNSIASHLSVNNVQKVNSFINKYNRVVYKYTY